MKHVVWIPLALLIGIALGGWAPRLEARRQALLVRDLRRQLEAAGPPRTALAAMSGILPLAPSARVEPRTEVPAAAPAPSGAAPEPAPESGEGAPETSAAEGRGPPENLREAIDQAADLWKVRSDVARAALIERAGFNADEAARFDVLMAGMNVRLRDVCARWAERLRQDEPFSPEMGIRMANEFTGALATTYDELDRRLPPTWRASGAAPVDLVDFVDPSVAEPLIDVEDKLDAGRPRGPRRGPWR